MCNDPVLDQIEFFLDTTYVAKFLLARRYDCCETPPGLLTEAATPAPDLWAEFECTYCGLGSEENWEALFRTIATMRRVATEVGQDLGYTYPKRLDQRVMDYLSRVRRLNRTAKSFS
jgi:hypothetical protein